ncbi:MAG: sensor histidine kinase [Thaumarchaeota archaeon]|nr:sensor histidine kinase [Nitrososphaerota archaeon]
MHDLGRTKLRTETIVSGSNEDFLEKAIDALSVLKISNSYIQSTIFTKTTDNKALAAFSMIKKSIVKIEAYLDSSKHEQKVSVKKGHDHSAENIKKRWFALTELMEMIKPKNVPSTIQINFPKNDFQIFGNFYKLVVVLSNLVENSIEAMKKNGVINILAREGIDYVQIDIKDSGPGLPTEIIKKAFSSLYTTKPDGNGLGLKVAKTIIELHGGTISVRNNPTTFSIKLPKN